MKMKCASEGNNPSQDNKAYLASPFVRQQQTRLLAAMKTN